MESRCLSLNRMSPADKPKKGRGRERLGSSDKSVLKENKKLLIGQTPILYRHRPFFGYLYGAQIDCFANGIIGGENCLCLCEFPYHTMVTLHCIGRINDSSDLSRVGKKRGKFLPVPVPGFEDIGILLVPGFPELLPCVFRIFQIDRAIDFPQACTYCFPVFIRSKFAAVPDLMDNAKLIPGLWENRVDGLGQSCQIIMTGNENVRNAPIFQVCTDAGIETGAVSRKVCKFF